MKIKREKKNKTKPKWIIAVNSTATDDDDDEMAWLAHRRVHISHIEYCRKRCDSFTWRPTPTQAPNKSLRHTYSYLHTHTHTLHCDDATHRHAASNEVITKNKIHCFLCGCVAGRSDKTIPLLRFDALSISLTSSAAATKRATTPSLPLSYALSLSSILWHLCGGARYTLFGYRSSLVFIWSNRNGLLWRWMWSHLFAYKPCNVRRNVCVCLLMC